MTFQLIMSNTADDVLRMTSNHIRLNEWQNVHWTDTFSLGRKMLTEWKICRQVPIWWVGVWNIAVTFQQVLICLVDYRN